MPSIFLDMTLSAAHHVESGQPAALVAKNGKIQMHIECRRGIIPLNRSSAFATPGTVAGM